MKSSGSWSADMTVVENNLRSSVLRADDFTSYLSLSAAHARAGRSSPDAVPSTMKKARSEQHSSNSAYACVSSLSRLALASAARFSRCDGSMGLVRAS